MIGTIPNNGSGSYKPGMPALLLIVAVALVATRSWAKEGSGTRGATVQSVADDSAVDALQSTARELRIRLYDAYRRDRRRYDRQTEYLQRLIDRWREQGQAAERAARLAHRLRLAMKDARFGSDAFDLVQWLGDETAAPSVASGPADVQRRSQTAGRPADRGARREGSQNSRPRDPVDIHLLRSRILAVNLQTAELYSELAATPDPKVEQLERHVRKLQSILSRRAVAQLYYESLDPNDRTRVDPPTDVQPIVLVLKARIAHKLGPSDTPAADVSVVSKDDQIRLNSLLRRLATWETTQ